jgi:hypothetical protein
VHSGELLSLRGVQTSQAAILWLGVFRSDQLACPTVAP